MKTPKSSPATTSPKSKSKTKTVPAGMHTVTPHLVCAGAVKAIAFYKKAFGAIELSRVPDSEGALLHAAVRIGDSVVMLNDEFPGMGALGPKARKGTSVTMHLSVDDADAWFARAIKAGATTVMPLQDMFWGDRYGILEDPFGHNWSIATHLRDMSPAEIRKAALVACG